jgi:hypothetical protein
MVIMAEQSAGYPTLVPENNTTDRLSSVGIPQPRRIVPTPGEDEALIMAQQGSRNSTQMEQRRGDRTAIAHIPQECCIAAPGKDALIAAAELGADNPILMLKNGADRFAGLGVP